MSTVFKDRTVPMSHARVLLTPHPMGHPLSALFDVEKQRAVLMAGLDFLEMAVAVATVVEYSDAYRTGQAPAERGGGRPFRLLEAIRGDRILDAPGNHPGAGDPVSSLVGHRQQGRERNRVDRERNAVRSRD